MIGSMLMKEEGVKEPPLASEDTAADARTRISREGPEDIIEENDDTIFDDIEDVLDREKAKNLFNRLLETDLDRKDRATKVFQFVFPWAFWLIMVITTTIVLTAWMGWDVSKELLNIWIFYTVPPAGKETLIPTAVSKGVPGIMAGIATSTIDICFSLFLIWNYDWVKKLPVLGPALEKTEAKGRQKVAKSRWFGKATFSLTTFVVFVPFSGSGGVGGTVFGRIVGLAPYKVLLAVVIGSTIGSTGFAFLSEQLTEFLGSDNPVVSFLSNLKILQLVAVLIVIAFVIYTIRYPKMAAIATKRVVHQALDITERTVDMAEEKSKKAQKMVVKGTKESLILMGEGNRIVSDLGLEIATKPMELMGKGGKKIKNDTKEFSMKQIGRAQSLAGGAIDRTVDIGERTTTRSIELATSITKKGIHETKAGWEEAGKVLVKGGEGIEKLYPKKKMMDSDKDNEDMTTSKPRKLQPPPAS